jgi:predicted flap endonuclease-1-like 5' DNA nuclease
MWFLLLQISLLLVLAALFGAGLAWWWLRRRYEDVTDSHERLMAETSRMDRLSVMASRDDVRAGVAELSTAVAEIKPTDLSPVLERLQRVEYFLAGLKPPDLGPMEQRISALGAQFAQRREPDFAPVAQRLEELQKTVLGIRIPAPDLGPVHSGIATLQLAVDRTQGVKSLEPVESKIAALETKLSEFVELLDHSRRSDHDALSTRLASVQSSVGALRNTELEPIAARLEAVEKAVANFHVPEQDLRPLHASIIDIERAVMALDKPQDLANDFAPVHGRLATLQASLASLQTEVRSRTALDALERRIASLQEAVQGMPEPDLSPVVGAVQSIEARLDLGALENRLTAIEYGLAALHHSLRARPEMVSRTETAWQRPSPNGLTQKPRLPAPPRPPREADPINAVRREDQANLLTDPVFGPPDDLEQIHGVGPMLRELLNDIGIYYFWQIAEWTPEEAAYVDNRLMHFRGRVRRDDWIDRARTLASAPTSARRPVSWEVRS